MSSNDVIKKLSEYLMKDWHPLDIDLLIAIGTNPIHDVIQFLSRDQLIQHSDRLVHIITGLYKIMESMKNEILTLHQRVNSANITEVVREDKLIQALSNLGIQPPTQSVMNSPMISTPVLSPSVLSPSLTSQSLMIEPSPRLV